MKLLYAGAVSAALLIEEQGDYYSKEAYTLYVNGSPVSGETSVISLYGLAPDTEYEVRNGEETLSRLQADDLRLRRQRQGKARLVQDD